MKMPKWRCLPREELGVFEGLMQPTHLIIILAIVLIVFGPGKISGIGGALGKGIREFKDSVEGQEAPEQPVQATVAQPMAVVAPVVAPVENPIETA